MKHFKLLRSGSLTSKTTDSKLPRLCAGKEELGILQKREVRSGPAWTVDPWRGGSSFSVLQRPLAATLSLLD